MHRITNEQAMEMAEHIFAIWEVTEPEWVIPDYSDDDVDDQDDDELDAGPRRACSRTGRQADPTPEEIAGTCAEIRAGWSEWTRRQRETVPAVPWRLIVAKVHEGN